MVEDEVEDPSWSGAEERAKTAFEAVLSCGTKIQGDHHLVFYARMPSPAHALLPEGLTETRRLRVWETTCLPR